MLLSKKSYPQVKNLTFENYLLYFMLILLKVNGKTELSTDSIFESNKKERKVTKRKKELQKYTHT